MSQPAAVRCAVAVIEELLAGGVREVVLAPGSRSAPLAFAAAAAERAGLLRLHVRLDERSAGFWALGLARGGRAAAVITTSGTAAAELHPAVLEAAHAGLAMIVITADRPATMIDTGANQTTRQWGLFGSAARAMIMINSADDPGTGERAWRIAVRRGVSSALGDRSANPGPVHLNVALTPPLAPDGPIAVQATRRSDRQPSTGPATDLDYRPGTVILAGDGAGSAARELAERAGLPLFAEPSSRARGGPQAIATYRLLLESGLGPAVQRVIVFGHPTLSRPVNELCARAEVVVVSGRPEWIDPLWDVAQVVWEIAELPQDESDWMLRWRRADVDLRHALGAARRPVWDGPTIAELIMTEVAGPIMIGSSNAIRDADLAGIGSNVDVHANRGLAGIDGTLSTAAGLALAREQPVTVLVGDLTFLHDLTGLLRGASEPAPDLRIVVVNDAGGAIFATLEQGAEAYAADFERLFGTAQQVDLEPLVQGLGGRFRRVSNVTELRAALADPVVGTTVLECQVGRDQRRAEGKRQRQTARNLAREP